MKFCTECGTKADFETQKFCKVCGHKFPEMPYTPAQPEAEATVTLLPDAAPADDSTVAAFAVPPVQEPEKPAEPESAPLQEDLTIGVQPPVEPQETEVPPAPADEATVFVPQAQQPAQPELDATTRAFEPVENNSYELGFQPAAEQTVRAESFFEEPQQTVADVVPPAPPAVEEPAPEPAPAPKKKGPAVLIVILVVVLLAALAVGGFFVWKKMGDSKNVTIGGTSYSIEETTSLTVDNPSSEDWTNLTSLPNLTSLTVTGSAELDETKLEKLTRLEKLEELSIDGMQFPDGLAGLSGMDALESLAMTNGQLTSEQCSGFSWSASLRKLDLSNNALTDISFLQGCTGLKELDLSGNQITDYTPLTALTALEVLSVDQCQAEPMSQLPSLGTLTIAGKSIEDPVKYLADQKSVVDLYNSMIGWFNSNDFNTLKVVLQQYGDAASLGSAALSYVNGWLMDAGEQWDNIKASLPADAKEVVVDDLGIYYGQMADGKRSGEGVQLFANNFSVYSGTWSNDLPNGTGTYRKTTADGTTLEFAGNYIDGYEDGEMTFTATNATGSQSGNYTASKGTRTTVKQISETQYAFVQFDTVYWYDTAPEGHGVAINSIPYQEEMAVQILPEPDPVPAASNSTASSSSSSSSKKNSGSSSKSSSTPAASTPAPAATPSAPAASTPSTDSASSEVTAADIIKGIQEGAQAAKEIYGAAKELYDLFN